MDYDGDGDQDILGGSYTGEIYLFERQGDEWAQGVFLRSGDGEALVTGTSVVPELCDMDADGDLDLVVGTRSDGVFLFRNSGSRSEPVWPESGEPMRTVSNELIKGSNAHFADWDQDGDADLVLGSEWGQVVWHQNVGSDAEPRFGPAQVLVAPIRNRSTDGFDPKGPASRVKVHVTDWNGDGRVDLLVGDVAWEWSDRAPLTPDEEDEKKELDIAYGNAKVAYDELFQETRDAFKTGDAPSPEDLAAFYAAKAEVDRLRRELRPFRERQSKTHGYVWLFLREP